jgi:hypothetical protein
MNDVYAINLLRGIGAEVPMPDESSVAAAREKFVSELREAPAAPARRTKSTRSSGVPRSMRAVVIAVLIFAALVGAAVATISHFSGPIATVDESKDLGPLDQVSDLAIFQSPSQVKFAGSQAAAQISRTAAGSGRGSLASRIESSTARSVPIPGTDSQIWLVATPDDKLCIFTPVNGGFNSACGGPEVISKTGMIGIPSGSDGASRLAVSVAPDGSGLTITSVDGSVRRVAPYKGVSVTHVESTDSVSNGVVTLNVAKMPGAGVREQKAPPRTRRK